MDLNIPILRTKVVFVVPHAGGWWHMLAVCLVASVSMSIKHPKPPAMWPVSAPPPPVSQVKSWQMSPSSTGRGSTRGCPGRGPPRPSSRGGGCGRLLMSMTMGLCHWRRSHGYVHKNFVHSFLILMRIICFIKGCPRCDQCNWAVWMSSCHKCCFPSL